MADASYEREHMALHAAGYINGAGTTVLTLGCQMTRIAEGHYGMLLDASEGVVNDESFTMVQCKGTVSAGAVVQDLSNVDKRIRVTDNNASEVDTDIEVQLYKSVTR